MNKLALRQSIPDRSGDPVREISLTINGTAITAEVSPRLLLSDFLRDKLGLTGTHVGCEQGVCGCCTVVVDGVAVRSCLTFAVQTDGSTVETIESVAEPDGTLHAIQQAFMENHALQCGFCTPGFVMSIKNHLERNPDPDLSDEAIREVLSGNLCRCTGYKNIVAAYRRAVELMQG